VTAVALRAPARWQDALRAEMAIVRSVRPFRWVFLFLIFAGINGLGEFPVREGQPPYGIFRFAVVMMFLLPLAWQGRGGAGVAPLPLTDATRTTVRVLCGAATAGLVFALGVALYVIGANRSFDMADEFNTLELFTPAYPLSLTLAGVGNYLLGAALMLRAERPGRVLLAGLIVAALLLRVAGIELDHTEIERVDSWPEEPRYAGGSSLTLTAALLRLLLGIAAVGVVAWWDGSRSRRWSGSARRRTRFPAPARARALPLAVPRPRTAVAVVFARHLLLLAPRMVLPLLLGVYVAWVIAPGDVVYQPEPRNYPPEAIRRIIFPEPLGILMIIGFLWPLLVWLDEWQVRPWDDAHPVDTLSRRLLHAAAGMVWLLVIGVVMGAAFVSRAVRAAADLPTWLWLGLPVALLTLYCLGTLATVGAGEDQPVVAGVVWSVALVPLLLGLQMVFSGFEREEPGPLAPTRVLAAVNWFGPETGHWSTPVALLWTLVFLATATLAVWFRTRGDQYGWSPSLPGMIRHLRRPR
jgi:hypothetical protein